SAARIRRVVDVHRERARIGHSILLVSPNPDGIGGGHRIDDADLREIARCGVVIHVQLSCVAHEGRVRAPWTGPLKMQKPPGACLDGLSISTLLGTWVPCCSCREMFKLHVHLPERATRRTASIGAARNGGSTAASDDE